MPTSDHSTLGETADATSAGASDQGVPDEEPPAFTGEQLLSEAQNMIRGLLAAVLAQNVKAQRLLVKAIMELDDGGSGLQHAMEFLTAFRLQYVPVNRLLPGTIIGPAVPVRSGLSPEAVQEWETAAALVTQMWTGRAHLQANPTAEVVARMTLLRASTPVKTLALMFMAWSVAGMMEYSEDVKGQGFDYLATLLDIDASEQDVDAPS